MKPRELGAPKLPTLCHMRQFVREQASVLRSARALEDDDVAERDRALLDRPAPKDSETGAGLRHLIPFHLFAQASLMWQASSSVWCVPTLG